jgi:ferric-dicitrate binding protein FerR (iron transport regulator)
MENDSKHNAPFDLLIRYFAHEASDEERLQLEQWRDASDENRKEFNAFATFWNLSDSVKTHPDIDVDTEWKHLDKIISPSKGKVLSFTRILQIAASLIIIFGLSFLLINQAQKNTTKTQAAQVKTLTLPDGSEVTLNADSKLVYSQNFGEKNREVTLKGEAFFKVTKNKNLPFIIDAQGASIKVVGTQFNVKAYKGHAEVKVTVVEGSVQLYESKSPEKQAVLKAGETGIYLRKQQIINKIPQISTNDISWKTNLIVFENTPLFEVAEVLRQVYHINIKVTDAVKNCTVTVEFDQKDLASVLKVLKSTLDLTITKEGKTLIITGSGCDNS